MNRTKKLKLFLDASVLIAMSESPGGGSGIVIGACKMGLSRAAATRLVLIEAERNIAEKLSRETLLRFYQNIAQMGLRVQRAASKKEIEFYSGIIRGKDAHVLAAALASKSDFLLTLDRRHFQTRRIEKAGINIQILTPGQFLEKHILG